MNIVGATDKGKIRSVNEDGFDYGIFEDGTAWAIVCDGMGGVRGGHIASRIVLDMVSEKIKKCYNKNMPTHCFENVFLSTITTANVIVYDRSFIDEDLKGMGTTIAAVIVKDKTACIAHVGDSRVYKISGDTISQITKDHSLAQEMLDSGQLTKEEFEHYPKKNIITRALGVDETIDIDFDFTDIDEGDALVLCSDGLSGLINDNEILKVYKENELDKVCEKYIEEANNNGGHDNITVVVMKG